MSRSWIPLALFALGCGAARAPSPTEATPGLVFPAEFAEGKGDDEGSEVARSKPPAPPPESAKEPAGSQPDPEPLRQAEQYEYDLVHDRGKVSVKSVRAVTYPTPVVTVRRMGRFAIELWIGQELVDRVRFDFPLTAADEPSPPGPKPLSAPPTLGAGATVTQRVLVPAADRARRATLVDRATGATTELPWPPDREAKPAVSQAAPNVTDGT